MKSPFFLSVFLLARRAICTGSPLYQYDPDTVKDCIEWYNNDEGDTCNYVRKYFGITLADFTARNPLEGLDDPYYEPWEWLGRDLAIFVNMFLTCPS